MGEYGWGGAKYPFLDIAADDLIVIDFSDSFSNQLKEVLKPVVYDIVEGWSIDSTQMTLFTIWT